MPAYKDKTRGTWYVKFQVTDTLTGARKAVLRRGFATRREALNYEAEHRAEGAKTRHTTFDAIFEEYLKGLDANEATKQQKRSWLIQYFPMYEEEMERLTRPALVQWRNSLKDTGLSARTINRGISFVRAVCKYAETVYGAQNNAVVLQNYKREQKPAAQQVWTVDEFNAFLECVDGEYYKAYFTFLFWTGCRRSEALAVCAEDITGNKVHIHRAIKHYKNGFIPLKNGSSERTITIDARTMEILQPFIECAAPFVFGGETSLSITQVQERFSKAIKKSGVHPIRIHDLRHSHATLLINNGVNIVAVSKRLGHSSVNMTLEVYTHLLQKTDDELVETLEKLH